jgi:hypothetical protein
VLDGARQHGEHDIVANDGAVRLVEGGTSRRSHSNELGRR